MVILVRHGESVINKFRSGYAFDTPGNREAARRACGGTLADHRVPLTENGFRQARHAGSFLGQIMPQVDTVFCSPYLRASQTLAAMATAHGNISLEGVRYDDRIRERRSGFCSEMTIDEVKHHFPYQQDYWREYGDFYARSPGGESLADLATGRIGYFLDNLRQLKADANVLVVTHGNAMRVIRHLVDDTDRATINSIRALNCCLWEYDPNRACPKIREL